MNMILTEEQLQLLGIYSLNSKVFPNRYYIPFVGEVNLYENTDINDILQMIYSTGVESGIREGKRIKIDEIKNVLNIE